MSSPPIPTSTEAVHFSDDAPRERPVAATSDVERVLTAALVEIDAVDPAHQ